MTGCSRTCTLGEPSHCCPRGGIRIGGRFNVPQSAPAPTERSISRVQLRQRPCLGSDSLTQNSAKTSECRRNTRTQPCVATHDASSTCKTPSRDQAALRGFKRTTDANNRHERTDGTRQPSILTLRGKAGCGRPLDSGTRSSYSSQPNVTTSKNGAAVQQSALRPGAGKTLALFKGANEKAVATGGESCMSAFCIKGRRLSASPDNDVSNSAESSPYRLQSSVSRSTQTECAQSLCHKEPGAHCLICGWSRSVVISGAAEQHRHCGDGGYGLKRSRSAPEERCGKSEDPWTPAWKESPEVSTAPRVIPPVLDNQGVPGGEKECDRHASSGVFHSPEVKHTGDVGTSRPGRTSAFRDAPCETGSAERSILKECCSHLQKQCINSPRSRRIAAQAANVEEARVEMSRCNDFALISCSTQTQEVCCPESEKSGSNLNGSNLAHGKNAIVVPHTLQIIERVNALQQSLASRNAVISILLQRCIDQEERSRRMLLGVLAQLSEQRRTLLQQKQQLQRAEADILVLKSASTPSLTTSISSESNLHCPQSLRWSRSRSSTRCSIDNITNTISPAPIVPVKGLDGKHFVVRGEHSSDSRSETDSEVSSSNIRRQLALANALVAWESEEEPRVSTYQTNGEHTTEIIPLSESEEDAPSHMSVRGTKTIPSSSTSSALPTAPQVTCTSTVSQYDLRFPAEKCTSTSLSTAKLLEGLPPRQLSPSVDEDMRLLVQPRKPRAGSTGLSPVRNAEKSRALLFDSTTHEANALRGSFNQSQDQLVSVNLVPISAALNELVQCEISALSDKGCPCCGMAGWTFRNVKSFTFTCLERVVTRARTACEGASSFCLYIAAIAFTGLGYILPHSKQHQFHICFSPYCPGCCVPAGAISSPLFLMKQNPFLPLRTHFPQGATVAAAFICSSYF